MYDEQTELDEFLDSMGCPEINEEQQLEIAKGELSDDDD